MSRPRIAIVENSLAVTGALTSVLRSCENLSGSFEFVFAMPETSGAIQFVKQRGFDVVLFPMSGLRRNAGSVLKYLPSLLMNARRFHAFVASSNVSLVINNDLYNLIPPMYRMTGGKVPYVSYVRFLPSVFPGWIFNLWLRMHERHSSAIIAVSAAVAGQLSSSRKIVVIGHEVPDEGGAESPAANVFLYPSNFTPGKGHEFAVEAFAKISDKHPEWRLVFAGGDFGLEKNRQFRQGIVQRARELNIESKISFLPFVDDQRALYASGEIVLMFSEAESFSMVCLEAMNLGRPVIATRCGGPEEIIEHNESGLLVKNRDVAAMAEAMGRLASDKTLRQSIGAAAKARVKEKFSRANTVEKLRTLLIDTLRHHRP